MTIIVFLIDTSPSMNQRCSAGPSFLDLAKGAVETFLKFRSRDPSSRGQDRYMLLTFDEPPKNIKAGWKENQATFMLELKNLKATGSTTVGQALGNVFHLLNVNRMQSGIDNFGFGRYPSYVEPVVVLLLSDGGHLVPENKNLDNELEITRSNLPGCEFYSDPFRWDQRIFFVLMRIPGQVPKINNGNSSSNNNNGPNSSPAPQPITSQQSATVAPQGQIPPDNTPVEALCESTGGRSYCVTSQKMLYQCMECLVQKVQTGIVVNLEKVGPDPQPIANNNNNNLPSTPSQEDNKKNIIENGFLTPQNQPKMNHVMESTAGSGDQAEDKEMVVSTNENTPSSTNGPVTWRKTKRMIYVPRAAGRGCVLSHWPLPEPYWPEPSLSTLPPRAAHVTLKFKCDPQEPLLLNELPYDKYELEPSPLTQFILDRKQPQICWQIFVSQSIRYPELGHPIGYLKASSTLSCVNLIIMPYNYPILIQLLEELKTNLKFKPTHNWRAKFDKYLRSIPPYYLMPLKKILAKNGFHVMPESIDNFLSYNILSYIGKIKHKGREEFDRLCQTVLANQQQAAQIRHPIETGVKLLPTPTNSNKISAKYFPNASDNSTNQETASQPKSTNSQFDWSAYLNEFNGFRVHFRAIGAPSSGANVKLGSRLSLIGSSPVLRLDQSASAPPPVSYQQQFRNPFDIARSNLLKQIEKMRINLAQHFKKPTIPVLEGGIPGTRLKLQDAEELHRLPISQMGNYQDYLRFMPPPLKLLETPPVRQHAFGNPFKVDKRMLVDEADLDINLATTSASASSGAPPGGGGGGPSGASPSSSAVPNPKLLARKTSSNLSPDSNHVTARSLANSFSLASRQHPLKRKPGPLPRDFSYRKLRRLDSYDDNSSLASVASSPARSSISSLDEEEEETPLYIDQEEEYDDHVTPSTSNENAEMNFNDSNFDSSSVSLDFEPLKIDDESDLEENRPIETENVDNVVKDAQKPSTSENHVTSNSAAPAKPASQSGEAAAKPSSSAKTVAKKRSCEFFPPELLPKLKNRISAMIRRPGKDYKEIFKIFDETKISTNNNQSVVQYLINFAYKESIRFKRTVLCEKLRSENLHRTQKTIIEKPDSLYNTLKTILNNNSTNSSNKQEKMTSSAKEVTSSASVTSSSGKMTSSRSTGNAIKSILKTKR